MPNPHTTCYVFDNIPGSGKDWTLAVFATGEKDARNYIRANHPGARLVNVIKDGKVDACCGAVTESARVP